MGQITIHIEGSFEPNRRVTISALDTGHADCVTKAIQYLAEMVLPRAIRQDHELHEAGHKPREGFGRAP